MKTATVTWISYNNYGTFLQAYALQQKIAQLGYENDIISDRNILEEFCQKKQIQDFSAGSGTNDPAVHSRPSYYTRIKRLLCNPRRWKRVLLAHTNAGEYIRPYAESQKKFETFRQNRLAITCDYHARELDALNAQYDAFICGSDQIWSVLAENFNPFYFLNFTSRKIAYAPSLGTDQISPEQRILIQQYLTGFQALSVREKSSAEWLTAALGKEVAWVADPTLLHDREFWSRFAENVPHVKKKYLLCYFLSNKDWYFRYAKELARKLHLQIILIPNKMQYIESEYVTRRGVGPTEFVALFERASYVLTDSYHGSVFSVLFHRNFQYLQRFKDTDANSQNIRIYSLFRRLGLESRIVQEDQTESVRLTMEYSEIDKKLCEFKEYSEKFLSASLQQLEKDLL